MKKLHIIWTVLAAVALAACATVEKEEEPEVVVPEGSKVLTIEATRVDDTKTAYAGEVTFSWSAGDQISVLCNDGSQNFWQTFTVDTPSASSTFTATVANGVNIGAKDDGTKVALYPADDAHVYNSASDIKFHIPASRDFRTANGGHKETAIPMFAWGDGNNTFAFANLTGAAKFTFSDIPSTTTQVKFVFKNTGHAKLNGDYALGVSANTAAENVSWPVVNTDTDTEKIVTYFGDVENGIASFYIPFGTGTIWASDHLWLYDATTNAILFPKTSSYTDGHFRVGGDIKITKNKIAVLPALNVGSGSVEVPGKTSAYSIDWSAVDAVSNGGSSAIRTMKSTADEDYLYVYLEVNPSLLDRTHAYAHYLRVYAAGASGSNNYWSNSCAISQIGEEGWAVVDGNISFENWDNSNSYSSSDVLAQTNTWYYEIRYSRTASETSAILGSAGTLNIGVVLDDIYTDDGTNYYNLSGGAIVGVIPTADSAMYQVTLPAISSAFSYTSAYNLDWSNVEVAENTSGALKSMRAQSQGDYLYLLLEADPAQMETNHTYAHRIDLFAGNWSTGFGVQSWAILNSAAAYKNWQSGYSDCTPNTSSNSSWFYEIRISRNHSSTYSSVGAAGTVGIGIKMDNCICDNDGSGEVWGYTNGGTTDATIGQIPSSDLYPVTFATVANPPAVSVNINQSFSESDANISNPERGLYKMVEYMYKNGTSNWTSATESLTDKYDENNTLTLTLFYLMDFVESNKLSDAALTHIGNVFSTVRSSGKKAIVRFAYSNVHEDKFHNPQDITQEPTLSQIKAHMTQLTPILEANKDVICVVQAGFIGTYGEWYYTTHFSRFSLGGMEWDETDQQYKQTYVEERDYTIHGSGNNRYVTEFENRAAVLDALLSMVPNNRQIELRTPTYKQCYLSPDLLSSYEHLTGFGTDAVHRIGFHNDAFLYGGEDMGTFHYSWERPLWQDHGAYQINGGEAPYSSTAVSEMEGSVYSNVHDAIFNYHYTYLHHDTAYHSGSTGGSSLMKYWHQQGWMTDIKKWLGYRLYLDSASISGSGCTSGSTLTVSVKLNNSGAAPIINERPMKLVLLHNGTPTVLADLGDPRTVASQGTQTFSKTFTLSQDIVTGDQLALWLPDNATGLQGRAEYSIRLANTETTWTSGGYNVFYTF